MVARIELSKISEWRTNKDHRVEVFDTSPQSEGGNRWRIWNDEHCWCNRYPNYTNGYSTDDEKQVLVDAGILENKDDPQSLSPNMELRTEDDGECWVSHSSCCVGDYGGAGSIGQANINWLRQREDEYEVSIDRGRYSSEQAWLPDNPANRELLETLDDYPLFDEESHSQVESDWESEAWDSWLKSDLVATLPECLQDYVDGVDGLYSIYREAMENTNTYVVHEYNGVSVPIDHIKDEFASLVGDVAITDGEWLNTSLAALGCPVTATVDDMGESVNETCLNIALDWCEENAVEDSLVEWLRDRIGRSVRTHEDSSPLEGKVSS